MLNLNPANEDCHNLQLPPPLPAGIWLTLGLEHDGLDEPVTLLTLGHIDVLIHKGCHSC